MKILLVIPARYKSTRLPGKPLIDLEGKSMIVRTYEQCLKVFLPSQIVVATDDQRILDHCNFNRINAVLTSDNCLTGTDRVAEVSNIVEADYYINVQGDEPLFNPQDIKEIVDAIQSNCGKILNGYCAIDSLDQYMSRTIPKVVFRPDGRLLYMSRTPIPGNKESQFIQAWRQVCIYAFPKEALIKFGELSMKTNLEGIEDIEILRFLELGFDVHMVRLSNASIAVDTAFDVERVKKYLRTKDPLI